MHTFITMLRILALTPLSLTILGGSANAFDPFLPVPKSDIWWRERHKELLQRTKEGPVELLFLGDSIMQGWNCRPVLSQPATPNDGAGRSIWDKLYAPKQAANLSIGGDGIENLIWRITTGNQWTQSQSHRPPDRDR